MWIERDILHRIQAVLAQRPVVLVTGSRQVGKTMLLEQNFPTYGYVSLDLPTEAEEAEQDGARFLTRHQPPLIIDEVQYAPHLFRALKVAVDANRQVNGRLCAFGKPA